MAGNLGAAIRVAANFGVPRIELVRPLVDPTADEVGQWACGGDQRVAMSLHDTLGGAAASSRLVVGTASARGRQDQPVISPKELAVAVAEVGPDATALVFGNETRGLRRDDLDRCDLVVRVPTRSDFPVLNLAQTVAILVGYLAIELSPSEAGAEPPAPHHEVQGLMDHLQRALLAIGFLDPANPQRILRLLRRMFGRAGVTSHEVTILRGICRQTEWVADQNPREPLEP